MKKLITLSLALTFITTVFATGRDLYGSDAAKIFPGATHAWVKDESRVPDLIEFGAGANIAPESFFATMTMVFHLPSSYYYKVLRSEQDQYGWEHRRCQLTVNGVAVTDGIFLIHIKNGVVQKYNGYMPYSLSIANAPSIHESAALANALTDIGATQYKWQVPGENDFLKKMTNDPNATYYPKGELFAVQKYDDLGSNTVFHLAWRFDVYAVQPLSRDYVYVDAVTGAVLRRDSRIEAANTAATAQTVYRGTRAIQTDSYNGAYRLRETTRGLGINTYNMHAGTSYNGATDFTNSTTTWNNVNANRDQYATDAHWGGEMTSDFYLNTFGRNGIDGNGYALNLYVHYSTNYVNAFWDGQEMNFGDGDVTQSANPLVSLDVTGHEISHGLTDFTCALNYRGESGAMNEAFSDIMGTAVEYYADSTRANWTIGEDFGPAFRSMVNPGAYRQPSVYQGTYWASLTGADNGGVHTNSGVENRWYCLLAQGGTNNNITMTGIGRAKATAIAWRMQVFYLISSSQYIDARTYSIQAATDLYGACSPEVIATAQAWHAVGLGAGLSGTPSVALTAPASTCSLPFSASFGNQSTDAVSYEWYFGDGDSSSAATPTHIYTTGGNYTVTLLARGCIGNASNTASVSISPPTAPTATADPCVAGTVTLHATSASGSVLWYANTIDTTVLSSSTSYTTPPLSSSTTYYVSEVVSSPIVTTGLPDTTGGGGYLNNASRGLRFKVNLPSILRSVYVYSQNSAAITVQYRDTARNVLASRNVTVPAGGGRVTLDIDLQAGGSTVYELGLNSTSTATLYRNNVGAIYPYNDGLGLITMIGNNIPPGTNTGGNPSSGYYYYFYDWIVQAPACISARTPVLAALSPGCANGIDAVSSSISASVYPNPANAQINVTVGSTAAETITISIVDMLGREMVSRSFKAGNDISTSFDAATWAEGVYMVEIKSGHHTVTRKVTVER